MQQSAHFAPIALANQFAVERLMGSKSMLLHCLVGFRVSRSKYFTWQGNCTQLLGVDALPAIGAFAKRAPALQMGLNGKQHVGT